MDRLTIFVAVDSLKHLAKNAIEKKVIAVEVEIQNEGLI